MSDHSFLSKQALPEYEYPSYFYAGFWSRLSAFVIDLLMVGSLVTILINTPLALFSIPAFEWKIFRRISELAVYLLYFITLTKLTNGQTLGKMILGIRVVHIGRESLSWDTVIIREGCGRLMLKILPFLYLPMFFNRKKQQMADILCDTSVVSEKIKQISSDAFLWKMKSNIAEGQDGKEPSERPLSSQPSRILRMPETVSMQKNQEINEGESEAEKIRIVPPVMQSSERTREGGTIRDETRPIQRMEEAFMTQDQADEKPEAEKISEAASGLGEEELLPSRAENEDMGSVNGGLWDDLVYLDEKEETSEKRDEWY
ncbi:MAG: RDD family protein [Peptostreptococcaceae bacterium]|nr:RDD family protein [Peptostreptococcaceae bacterium]